MSKKVSGWPLIAPREIPEELPAVTTDDVGKVLEVVNGHESTIFVPEQEVTLTSAGDYYAADLLNVTLTPSDFDTESVAIVHLTDGEHPYTVAIPYDDNLSEVNMPGFLDEVSSLIIAYNVNKWQVLSPASMPTITVSATAIAISDNPEISWETVDALPPIEESDMGKVLTAGEGEPIWATALPTIAAGDAGKVLTVNAGETGTEWAAASGGGGYIDLYIGQYPYTNHNITHADFYNAVTEAIRTGKNIRLIPNSAGTAEQNIHSARIGSFLDNNGYTSVFGISITKSSITGTVIDWIQATATTNTPTTKQSFDYFSLTLAQPNS